MKKWIKKLSLFTSIAATTGFGFSVSINYDQNLVRDIWKYDNIHSKLWNKLGVKERSNKEVKIGIIDDGVIDFNILKFNGNTTDNVYQSNRKLNYNLFDMYYYINDIFSQTEEISNNNAKSGYVNYNNDLTSTDVYYKIKNSDKGAKYERYDDSFLKSWQINGHATKIASIIGSDSGLLRNAKFYSTSFRRIQKKSNLEILRSNLEFFRKNRVKYINLSYSNFYDKTFFDLYNAILNLNFSEIATKNKNFEKIISIEYPDEAALLDEYAYKYDMKFFISAGNSNESIPKWLDLIQELIYKKLNLNNLSSQNKSILEKTKEIFNAELEFWKKPFSIQRSKNTFIIGAYDINTNEVENYSNGTIKKFEDSPLGLGPDKFSEETLLLEPDPQSTSTKFDDPDINKWAGTSFSTPVLLALSALLSALNNYDYEVPELKAILLASFDLGKYDNYAPNDIPKNVGSGFINWKKMKYFSKKIKKIKVKDLYYAKNQEMKFTKEVSGDGRFIAIVSSFSDLHKLSKKERETIDKKEIDQHINIINTKLKGDIYATPEWTYRQFHLSSYSGIGKNNDIDDNATSTNRYILPNKWTSQFYPFQYSLTIKLKKDYNWYNLYYDSIYIILEDRDGKDVYLNKLSV
ncbi:subtilase family protein [Mycoplasmopsis mustelae]|uniref:Subtilase family protein n=1 Tax=Mycoplasmopsis mustelae TaxID=171289 RepID=A0A4R7UCD1_9BACT|nr:S8 family serine peptidase [Mycoplasmopsis mustelae]TDV23586.1 subtilase family protein [Mycoplasmopsis mustelae]